MRQLLTILACFCLLAGGATPAADLDHLGADHDGLGDDMGLVESCTAGGPNDPSDDEGDDEGDDRVFCVCHMPPGNEDNPQTICIGVPALCVHLGHGDTLGPCAETCGGAEGAGCPDGQFCKYPPGECAEDAEGRCMDLPGACPGLYAPVCGCDGRTYSNPCYADAAGVGIDHEGACDEMQACGGSAGETCENDEFCLRPVGECSTDAEGVCVVVPDACPDVIRPVCGCDDMTYDNACLALIAGVSIAAPGACEEITACGGTEGDTCEEGQFCKAQPGMCEEGAEGVCTEQPDACPPVIMPVCGCDDVTYDNRCLADAVGVNVAHPGECEVMTPCGGSEGIACADGEFCLRDPGACGDEEEGVCVEKPALCPPVMAPVCGCDDMEYTSACFAHAAGVTVQNEGPCQSTTKGARGARRGWLRSR